MKPFDSQDKRFVLIDGNAILHRAYHALPPLTDQNGRVVNAVYGFCSMLLKVIADLKPNYLAVAFDRAAPTFRQQLYVGYQAQRPQMADDLSPQVDMVHQVLEKMGIQIFEIDGYEADDIIGTIAHSLAGPAAHHLASAPLVSPDGTERVRASKVSDSRHPQEIEVIIVSGDRDMLQLVNDHVKVYAPIIGLTKTILYDAKSVEEKYGVKPSQIIDYKALIGDPSDNYPGVSGIGPKTAGQLLREFGSLKSLYKNIGKLPLKIGERLATDAEQASLAKKLATITTDAPISFDIGKCSVKYFDVDSAKKSFEEFGFKSLLKRLPGYVEEPVEKPPKKQSAKKHQGQLGLL